MIKKETSVPLLTPPVPSVSLSLTVDIPVSAVGAVLQHTVDGQISPSAFFSQQLMSAVITVNLIISYSPYIYRSAISSINWKFVIL